jgi:hypothetical protein
MNFIERFSCCVLFALSIVCGARDVAAQAPSDKVTVLRLGPAEIRVSGPWVESPIQYARAIELVVASQFRVRPEARTTDTQTPTEQLIEMPLARMLITTEPRTSYEEALRRLDEIAASRPEPARFLEVGGWPAVELEFQEPLPQRGQRGGAPDAVITRAWTAIAVGAQLVNFDITLLPNSPLELLRDGQALARDTILPANLNPAATQQEIERLQSRESARKAQRVPERRGMAPQNATDAAPPRETQEVTEARSGALAVSGAPGAPRSEVEIAASRNANTIIIAANFGISFSRNRGGSFSASNPGLFPPNDPSVARGVSGNFYLDVIASPTGGPGQLGVSGCTNAVSRSTDNGASFSLQGYSAVCPATGAGICFPDQEHLAADAATPGNDQLYAVWRNFTLTPGTLLPTCQSLIVTGGPLTASISCSQDNGVNWTARAPLNGFVGDFPRVAVASDGAVYVVTLGSANNVILSRYSSCATGLTPVPGFPRIVAILTGNVTCPVPGLDRCNAGNTLESPTIAPDPDNAARIFLSYAESDGAGGERIVTRESTDRGLTFGPAATVSGSSSARRFMPWSCSTRGRAWVGWYDRTAATVAGASNDLTDYFVGVANAAPRNVSQRPDPQCASGWPTPPRSPSDATSCGSPQLAGVCQRPGGLGSQNPCDFATPVCPTAPIRETCQTGRGQPKYGDYNGLACAGDFVIAAWASATAPPGLAAATGISVYSSTMLIQDGGLSPANPVVDFPSPALDVLLKGKEDDFLFPVVDFLLTKEPLDLTSVRYIILGP